MAFRAAVALPGHLGVELDVRHLNEADTAELAGWIAVYKQLRDRLHHGHVWQGTGEDSLVWQAHGDDAATDVLLLAYRPQPTTHRYSPTLAPANAGHHGPLRPCVKCCPPAPCARPAATTLRPSSTPSTRPKA